MIQTQKAKDMVITLLSESGQWTQGKNSFVLEFTSADDQAARGRRQSHPEYQYADARHGADARRRHAVPGQDAWALSRDDQLSGPWGAASHGGLGWARGQGLDPVLGPCALGSAERRHQGHQAPAQKERTMERQSEEVMHEPPRRREKRHRLGRRLVMVVGALGLLAGGVLGASSPHAIWMGSLVLPWRVPRHPHPRRRCLHRQSANTPEAPAEVVLSPEAVSRAGIKTAPAEAAASQVTMQLPGTVMADAYREVKVVPLVGGIVTKVHVELGADRQARRPAGDAV